MSENLSKLKAQILLWFAPLFSALQNRAEMIADLFEVQHRKWNARDTNSAGESINQLVVIGATLFIGIVVIASIGEAMPDNENGMFSGAMSQAETILESSLILGALLPLVVIAGALLFYVRTFNGGGNGGGRR